MMIPLKIRDLPYVVFFQFDLGSNMTMLYGNALDTIAVKHPEIRKSIALVDRKQGIQAYKNIELQMEKYSAFNPNCYVASYYGQNFLSSDLDTDTVQVGTIGVDMFQGKILVIDYPGQRFAICDVLPNELATTLYDIELDKTGRAILPMQIHNKTYRVMFDNGSSLFPIIGPTNLVESLAKNPYSDSMTISSWGKHHMVKGKLLTDSFRLAGHVFPGCMVYADSRDEAKSEHYDLIAGNALFWDHIVIIDFKRNKFGIK